jgi:hypothetical protein
MEAVGTQVRHKNCISHIKWNDLFFQLSGKQDDLFPTDKHPEPSITKLSDNTFALGKDTQSIFMNTKGDPIQKYAVRWSEVPLAIGKCY